MMIMKEYTYLKTWIAFKLAVTSFVVIVTILKKNKILKYCIQNNDTRIKVIIVPRIF